MSKGSAIQVSASVPGRGVMQLGGAGSAGCSAGDAPKDCAKRQDDCINREGGKSP